MINLLICLSSFLVFLKSIVLCNKLSDIHVNLRMDVRVNNVIDPGAFTTNASQEQQTYEQGTSTH